MRLTWIHKLNTPQSVERFYEFFLELHVNARCEEETWAGGPGKQCVATPCWWFIWQTKICSLGSTFKTPHALWLTPFLLCFLYSSTIAHTAGLKNIPSAVKGTAQYSVVSPAAHVITGWKSTDTRGDRSGHNTFVCWCYMLAQALLSGNGAKEERDSESELHGAGWDLGHSRDFLMGCGWSDSWCKNLYPATTKLNRQK